MSGKYTAYPEYKYSEVEWLGDIPSGWKMWKLGHAYTEIGSGTTPPSDSGKWYGGTVPWVTTGELRENKIVDTTKKLTEVALRVFPTLRKYPKGSVAIAMYGATIGRLGFFGIEATTNQACCVLSKSKVVDNRYLYFWLQAFREDIVNLASGGGQPNINQEIVSSLKVSSPSYTQQQQIAIFLDHETAKIDTLIEKQQQLIKLLKEKRQAVISHAVTKGLNPNTPMRDSGVEWLGEVPEHWQVKRLKNVARIVDCRNKTPEYFENGEYLVIRTTNIKKQKLNLNGALYTDKVNFKIWTQRGIPPTGSILFTREAPTGEICLVPDNLKFCLGQRMMNFICDKQEYTNFLFDFLLSDCLERYIESVSLGSTVSHLRVPQVENIPVIVPPLNELSEIHEKLSIIKEQFLELTKKAENAIQLMQERRTALISAAVTGKVDLRNWQAPENKHPEKEQTV